MNTDIVGKHFILNDKIVKVDEDIFLKLRPSLYELIKVVDGVAVFLEDHLERFEKSLEKSKIDFELDFKVLNSNISKLIKMENINLNNIKIIFGEIEGVPTCITYFSKSVYPDEEDYRLGVDTILYKHERKNPNIKFVAKEFWENVSYKIKDNNVFEAILYKENEDILEGSRSNIFFIKDSKLYTAKSEDVLEGITRKYILKSCLDNHIDVIFKNLKLKDLKTIDGIFMSSTTVDILKIVRVNDIEINTNSSSIVDVIIKRYAEYEKKYIEEKKS